jgi:coenzyme F420-reducing hydrogenase alpha subunit
MTTALNAIEDAMGVIPSPGVRRLRRIMSLSQIAASHLVHIYMLVLPDYMGIDLMTGKEKEIRRLSRMKDAFNNVTGTIGGRPLHPVSMVVGGFTRAPSKDAAKNLIRQLESVRKDALDTVRMVTALTYPDMSYEYEHMALSSPEAYAIDGGVIMTASGTRVSLPDYYDHFREDEVPYSHAKRTTMKGKSPLMVGALARMRIKYEKLHPEAHRAAVMTGFIPKGHNPFLNIIAQSIEIVHCINECIDLLEGFSPVDMMETVRAQEGVGSAATEAPRGLLYHAYKVNRFGVIESADLVTPTAYNFFAIESSLRSLITKNIHKPSGKLALLCEMLVRAFDPCFSCSVH